MENKWRGMQIKGQVSYKCRQKFKLGKEDLKRWNNGLFSNVEAQFDKLSKQIEMVDKNNERLELNETEMTLRRKCFQEIQDILRMRKEIQKQKSRNTWVHLKDANTHFFHRSVYAKRAQNAITSVLVKGGWIEKTDLVKMEAVRYFNKLFQKDQQNCLIMGGIQFNRILVEKRE